MLTELWRITSFRLTVLYGAIFALAVVGLVTLVYGETARYQDRQIDQILVSESQAFARSERTQLIANLDYEIARDARHINFFGLFAADGSRIAGNLHHVPAGLALDERAHELHSDASTGLFAQAHDVRAIGRHLDNGDVLVVARDLALLEQLRLALLRGCILIGVVILALGVLGGVFYSLPAVRHIRAIDDATRRIAAGDYSRRLPLGRRNRELDTLAGIVNIMLDETERLMGEVKSCSDNIAHDLRTPLTRLRASIYRTQQSLDAGSPLTALLDHALTQTDLLLNRFRALSRISEIEGKRRRAGIARAELTPILAKIRDLYEPLAQQGAVTLQLLVDDAVAHTEIDCDAELLFEAIGNLVDNAIKFTPPPGVIVMQLAAGVAGPTITVTDTGPGIAEDQRKLVMQRFYRASDARNVPGSGLGLSLVDAIVRLHDFGLEVGEAAGGGASITLLCWPQSPPATLAS